MKQFPKFAALALLAVAAGASAQQAQRKLYIVELVDKPLATYAGGVSGIAATKPAPGQKLNVNSTAAKAYSAYLVGKQNQVVSAAVPAARVGYRFRSALNGFSAALTDAELAKLVAHPGVRAVTLDAPVPLDTSNTPTFLGVNQPGGVWSQLDANGRAIKGEGVIIGHVDGGVWPENPSFSDKVDSITGKPIASHLPGTVVYDPLPPGRWNGSCQPSTGAGGQSFKASHCNNKLIGAKFFNATLKLALSLGLTRQWSGDYVDSPRDADGHGTHTLSTSGGNANVDANIQGPVVLSGIAPRARVAAYKSCYIPADANDNPQQGSCFTSDSVAAIDAAVADGVDVLNFSIGGSRTSVQDAGSTAFANAAFAGVFVSTSAGNSNVNGATTVAHISPWTTTVGNSTHDRNGAATVNFGNGTSAVGASYQTSGLSSKSLILSTEAGVMPFAALNNTDKAALGRCFNAADRADPLINVGGVAASNDAVLDPAKIAGKIVICVRGGNALVNKGTEVASRGGAGLIIQNVAAGVMPSPLNGASSDTQIYQPYVQPTVHLGAAVSAAVVAYATGGSGTASFDATTPLIGIAPVMNASSSRGPNQRDPHLLKPEITGPGTDIQAAYTNMTITPAQRQQIIDGTLVPGAGANSIGGTSMSAPHVAGAAALMRQANPTWSPFAIKSALLTSTVQNVKLANGATDANRWGYGAGHLNPNAALATKTVYDQTIGDHINYYFAAIDGRTLNIATLTHANVVGVGSLTRTLTNKGSSPVTYNAAADLPGFVVSVSPSQLTIPAGGTKTYTVTLQRTTAPIEQWQFGNLAWTSASAPTVYSPLSAKPSSIVALPTVTDTRNVGTKVITIQLGYTGPLVTTPTGLTAATVHQSQVALDQRVCFPFEVPAGAKTLRAQLFNSETEGGSASDLDLVVLRGATEVGSSLNGDSNEVVQLLNPTAATNYQACVDGFAPIGSGAFKLSVWVLGPAHAGTLKAFGPASVQTGQLASIGMNWNVPGGARYIGVVEYRQTAGGTPIGRTDLFIDAAASGQAQAAATFAPVFKEKSLRPR